MRLLRFVALAVLLAFPAVAQDADAAPEGERPAPSVTVATVVRSQVQARVPVSGTLVARDQVQVFPQVTGYEVTELLAEAGDTVRRGQVLARLSTDTLAAQLAQAEAEYQRAEAGIGQARSSIDSSAAMLLQAQTSLERAQSLRQSGSGSQAALDDAVAAEANARAQAASAADGVAVAQAALAQADAARRIARLNLERADIVAPVDGLVVARNAELGALSGGSTDPLFTLIADGAIEVEAEVIETALSGLKVGDLAEIDVAGVGQVAGTVRLVPASVDAITRLGLMRISLQPDPRLRTGLFASGWVITDQREALTVPATAVLSNADGDRVQVIRDGTVDTRTVQAGLLWQGMREITDGLAEGEQVMARAGAFFRTGDKVVPVTEEEAARQALGDGAGDTTQEAEDGDGPADGQAGGAANAGETASGQTTEGDAGAAGDGAETAGGATDAEAGSDEAQGGGTQP